MPHLRDCYYLLILLKIFRGRSGRCDRLAGSLYRHELRYSGLTRTQANSVLAIADRFGPEDFSYAVATDKLSTTTARSSFTRCYLDHQPLPTPPA